MSDKTFTQVLIDEVDRAASQDDWDALERELDEIERQSQEDFDDASSDDDALPSDSSKD